jgi:hypothetical protein
MQTLQNSNSIQVRLQEFYCLICGALQTKTNQLIKFIWNLFSDFVAPEQNRTSMLEFRLNFVPSSVSGLRVPLLRLPAAVRHCFHPLGELVVVVAVSGMIVLASVSFILERVVQNFLTTAPRLAVVTDALSPA